MSQLVNMIATRFQRLHPYMFPRGHTTGIYRLLGIRPISEHVVNQRWRHEPRTRIELVCEVYDCCARSRRRVVVAAKRSYY